MRSEVFPQFPKTRPVLPEAHRALYLKYYVANREGQTRATGLAARLEAWMHKQVAADRDSGKGATRSTLEVGAGTLNHLRYEAAAGPYDIVEPFRDLFVGSELLAKVRATYDDIGAVPSDVTYDRIISIATFEHLLDLPRVIALAALHLRERGTMRVAIPSEGSLAWRAGWTFTTGLEFRLRYGLDYGTLMRHEHVNTWKEIRSALRHFFGMVRGKSFGLSPALSFYQFYECREPARAKCEAFLSEWDERQA